MSPPIRPGQDSDADAIIRLIGDCWAEYPGCVLDVDGEVPELRALSTYFADAGGALWVVQDGQGIRGMVGVRPGAAGAAWEICRLYVAKAARGEGVAHALLDLAEDHARAAGAETLMLWTDTRFLRAHAFYEKRGYIRQGPIRVLDDLSHSLEFRYAKPALGLVAQTLDAAAAASAERGLAGLVRAAGAAAMPESWRGAAAGVAQGRRALVAAWRHGEIVGAAQLGLAEPAAPPHRAVMIGLLIAPDSDRASVARALLIEAEAAAVAHGKRLLVAEISADDPVADSFRDAGWQPAGRIPGGLAAPGGGVTDSVIFCRPLPSGMPGAEAPDVRR